MNKDRNIENIVHRKLFQQINSQRKLAIILLNIKLCFA